MAPATWDPDRFEPVRERLAKLVSSPQSNEIYAANRRSIFLVEDEVLGRVALKEMRHSGAMRQLWFRTVRSRDALREFRAGSGFEARGGKTPSFLGCAVEQTPFALKRVLLFIRWLDGAETLTEYLERNGGSAEPAVLAHLAQMLVESARLGLVHGRHSSENILVVAGDSLPEFYAIDFAYSKLRRRFDPRGFERDVARIAHWLWHEEICKAEDLERFFAAVTERAWPAEGPRGAHSGRIHAEFERWQRVFPKSAL